MKSFSELPLSPAVHASLARLGFTEPTPIQAQAIPPALSGNDVVATAQTGTGKTLAFVLPVLEMLSKPPIQLGINALILSPTRELAMQIEETFRNVSHGMGFRTALVVGGLNEQRQLQAVRGGAQVVIATPGRLQDFLNRRLIKFSGTRMLVLDEADRMLDMGFLPTIQEIMTALPTERQTLFFSATIESSVAHLINQHLKSPVRVAIGSTTKPADHIDLHVYEVEQDRKLSLLHHMLTSEEGTFLVFSRTKHGADRLAKRLVRTGVKATAIHGDRTQNQRNQALRGFQQGHYRVLVATDVAARGIHVEGIGHVVNYDLPQAPEDFIHRVGRTGRAGARGVATTFGTKSERGDIRKIERALRVQLMRREVLPEMLHEPVEIVPRPAALAAVAPAIAPRRFFPFKGNSGPKGKGPGFRAASGRRFSSPRSARP